MNWTCGETRRHLLEQDEFSEAALEHLSQCALCQEMIGLPTANELAGSITNVDGLDVASLLSQTQLQVSREWGLFAWLRSRKTPVRLALGLSVALIPAAAQLAFAHRTDLFDYPLARLLAATAAYLVAAVLATTALLSPLYRPRSFRGLWAVAAISFGLPFVVAALAPAHDQHISTASDMQHSFIVQAWICLRYGTLLSLPAVLLFFAMDRQLGKGRRFLTLTAGMGTVAGNFVLLLHCPNDQPAHQLLGHATVGLLLFVLIGAVIAVTRRKRSTAPTLGA